MGDVRDKTFIGPTSRTGRFTLTIEGSVTSRTIGAIITQLALTKEMLAEHEAEELAITDPLLDVEYGPLIR